MVLYACHVARQPTHASPSRCHLIALKGDSSLDLIGWSSRSRVPVLLLASSSYSWFSMNTSVFDVHTFLDFRSSSLSRRSRPGLTRPCIRPHVFAGLIHVLLVCVVQTYSSGQAEPFHYIMGRLNACTNELVRRAYSDLQATSFPRHPRVTVSAAGSSSGAVVDVHCPVNDQLVSQIMHERHRILREKKGIREGRGVLRVASCFCM